MAVIGERVKLYTVKTRGGRRGGGGESEVPSPFPLLVSPRYFFLREFFSLALLSKRLEQDNRPV